MKDKDIRRHSFDILDYGAVPDDWRLLDTTWPGIISPDIYDGKIGAIRSGRVRPTFKVLWARDTRDCRFDVSELTDSEGGKPDDIAKG